MLRCNNTDKISKTLQKHSWLKANFLVLALLLSIFTSLSIKLNANAATSVAYKHYSSGSVIGATGGSFGNSTTSFSKSTASLYIGQKEFQYTYSVGGFFGIGAEQKTASCAIKLKINLNSDLKTGSISPVSETSIDGTTTCYDEAKKISDFNQNNISISGSQSDTANISNISEISSDKYINIDAYSSKKGSELPSGLKIILSNRSGTVKTQSITFNSNGYSAHTDLSEIEPGDYTLCIEPAGAFDYEQCKSITKIAGHVLDIVFGSSSQDPSNNQVKVTVNRTISGNGKYSSDIELKDVSKNNYPVSTAQTNVFESNLSGATSSIQLKAVFDNIPNGNYKACLKSNNNVCSDQFTKKSGSSVDVTINVPSEADPGTIDTAKTSCGIDGIGWIVCPVVNFLANMADGAFGFLANNFLNTSPKIFDSSSPTYNAWSIMRSFANVAFVIAFLIIIFSQLTSYGISNYGIKKMLPKLVVAAILVNISYYICQIAVDISNIAGYSLQNLLSGLVPPTAESAGGTWSGNNSWTSMVGGVLMVGAGAAVVWASLAALVPMLIAAVVALIMILFILVARQAIIVLLIVLSPLAFVAYLLPNTEEWFKKWKTTFMAMLMLFPVIAVVFGVSSLASTILLNVFSESDSQMGQIIAASVMVLPLFVVPGLLKKSLDSVGSIGSRINGLGATMSGGLSKKGSEMYSNSAIERGRVAREQSIKNFKSQQFARNLGKAGGYTKFMAGSKVPKIFQSEAGKYASSQLESTALTAANKLDEEAVSNEVSLISARGFAKSGPGGVIVEAESVLQNAIKNGDTTQALAASKVLQKSGPGTTSLHKVLKNTIQTDENKDIMNSLKGDIISSSVKDRDIVLQKWAIDRKGLDITTLEGMSSTYTGLNASEFIKQNDNVIESAAGKIPKDFITDLLKDPILAKDLNIDREKLIRDTFGVPKEGQSEQGSKIETNNGAPFTYDDKGNQISKNGIIYPRDK